MREGPRTRLGPRGRALLITGIYLVIGSAWILFSDHLAVLVAGEAGQLVAFQRAKGLGYVALTAAGLYLLVAHNLHSIRSSALRVREQRRRNEALGAYLNAIINAAPVAVFDLTVQGRVQSIWNPAAQALFGYSAEEVMGSRPPVVPDENRHAVDDALAAMQAGATIHEHEVVLRAKDGTCFPALVAAAPVRHGEERLAVVLVSDLTPLRNAMNDLHSAIQEREVLLREVHHRVKNNLQIISSLLMLERHGSPAHSPVRAGLDRTLSRIRTIARVHEQLYHGSNLVRIDVASYLHGLITDIAAAYDPYGRITVESELAEVSADIDRTIPLGLMVHELLANCYQHAFPDPGRGVITLSLTRSDETLVLEIADDGIGTQPASGGEEPHIGRTLVQALARQIEGQVETDNEHGTSVTVRMPWS